MVRKHFRHNVSIWIIISVIAALAVTLAFMASTHLRRQQQQAVEMMTDKGATLINSFAAALRNPAYFKGDIFGLQKLVMETARQPDIDYIIVTDGSGNIIADSDPSSIGDRYGMDLDIGKIALSDEIRWRQVANSEGADTFEVYRGLFPAPEKTESGAAPPAPSNSLNDDNLIIYTGFNMEAIDRATGADTRNTIIIALILSLIGSSVIVSLFLAQAWRQTSSSLSRITVFSETLVKNMPIGLIAEDESGRIAACNEKAGNILNIVCGDVTGRKADSVLPATLGKMLVSLTPGGVVEKDVALTLRGENKILEVVAADLVADGIASGRMLLLRDVTSLRLLESEVAKSRHLKSLASLAAGVAHEIRNPLSSLKGFAVYFRERLTGNDEDAKTADVMIQETERVNRVVSQLIEFARPLELKKEESRMADLIQHTIALIAAQADTNHIAITVDAAPDLQPVEVDRDKVKQALLNVLINSLAALPSGGSIAVKITADNSDIFIAVNDTGSGISKSDLPRIYDPYFTSKPAGTGLGLAIVQKIMEAHGGAIAVESKPGSGTKVILRFPLNKISAKDIL